MAEPTSVCDHKFIDSRHCLKCGASYVELRRDQELAEFAYALDGCCYMDENDGPSIDQDEAKRLIAARDARLLAEALRPFEELAELLENFARHDTARMRECNRQDDFELGRKFASSAVAHEGTVEKLRKALEQARKAHPAGSDGSAGGEGQGHG